ncbi:hypothetical protein KC345_g311 [Hortaea werneckii]|nr:hypothetical protein KC345_g311 [Hortaea werneckii]
MHRGFFISLTYQCLQGRCSGLDPPSDSRVKHIGASVEVYCREALHISRVVCPEDGERCPCHLKCREVAMRWKASSTSQFKPEKWKSCTETSKTFRAICRLAANQAFAAGGGGAPARALDTWPKRLHSASRISTSKFWHCSPAYPISQPSTA